MSKDRLTGPGGFINISQCTRNVYFMMPFTTKGLEVSFPGDGTLKIDKEGKVKKFVNDVFEKTFSGDEAVRRGQQVFYVTERAVFRRTGKSEVIELVEIAPGVDLQKDVLDLMEFKPVISPNLRQMDSRIFMKEKMRALSEFFGSLEDRCTYHPNDHIMYLDLCGIALNEEDDVNWLFTGLNDILKPLVDAKGRIDMVVNYDGFDLRKGLEDSFGEQVILLERDLYKSVKRYSGQSFRRAQLGRNLQINDWSMDELFDLFDVNHDGTLSPEEIRNGMLSKFQIHLTPAQMAKFQRSDGINMVDRDTFEIGLKGVLETSA
jgi:propionate CoA-transferase